MTLAAATSHNRELMARSLLDEAAVNLHENAAARGHIAGCNAIFLEAPLFPNPSNRPDYETLYKGGWRMVDFDYWQPPLSIWSAGATQHILLVLVTPNVPKQSLPGKGTFYHLPRAMLKSFLLQHWRNHFHRIGRTQVARDPAYQKMMESLQGLEYVTLRDLPWAAPPTSKL